ncbi:uncharacterized protein LOC121005397 isoform X1 [Bufo bufo]|uniref:uncharacterized protein LOC121005397 isoform X1 n=1 Tax=Bufo bufo TaxID=8384 RepID=UPI001ABE64FC|nr:uncharacterized protein LOC121005397 isoform X1 [Bufo bufo]XP_040294065.1 uncharacterized protein LOC121005397 isoform X1 [Bufo bufo]
MDNHQPVASPDGSSETFLQGYPEENCNVLQHPQSEGLLDIKVEIIDEEEGTYMKVDQRYGSSKGSPSETCPSPLYSQDCSEENYNVQWDHQGEDLTHVKLEVKSEEELYVSGDQQGHEEEIPVDIVKGGGSFFSSRRLRSLQHGKERGSSMTTRRPYRRMDMDVGTLISLVHDRPELWDKSASGYSDRNRRDRAWLEICEALYPDWGEYTQDQQGVMEEYARKRWKSVRDRLLKEVKNAEKNGSSPSKRKKMPHYEELLFILPSRGSRTHQGNCQETDSPAESPTEPDEHQQREPASSTSTEPTHKVEVIQEDLSVHSWVATPPSPDIAATSAPTAAAVSKSVAAPAATRTTRPSPSSRTSFSRGRSRRSLRTMERQLEVESEVMSLIRRVDGDDRFDFFGYGLASLCRQMPTHIQDNFMSFVHAAAAVFGSANPLPDLGDLIQTLRWATGLRQQPPVSLPRPRVMSTSTQTDPVNFSAPSPPTTGSQFYNSFYPYPPAPYSNSGTNQNQQQPAASSTSTDFSPPHYTNF